ncbi:hypothetical protein [Sphingomonas aerophila]|jgi:hypothetical protein|uniref:Uncharacterized protein n=1 Tax=Sphingomonas aerophila TaxID=1344948 RepID=A0A7W9BCQ1_9SPHN|nr:hypothetical protein [Sphingomonas aerophila]MBB5714584.1 hypothetical protein [Sphingomonas aerophila]
MFLKTLFPTPKVARKPLTDRPFAAAFLSFVCTCSVLGGTTAIFNDGSASPQTAIARAA